MLPSPPSARLCYEARLASSPSSSVVHRLRVGSRKRGVQTSSPCHILSILTDEQYFGGCDDYIRQARKSGVTLPILYKNFVIDEAQLYAAALCGASAVLLIAACLSKEDCKRLIDKAHQLGLETLLEMHSKQELEYAEFEPDIYGINNRNLGSFITDVENSFRLAELLPKDAVKVSESGISDPATVKALRQAGFQGFLIGENFMKTPDPGQALHDFITHL